MQSLINIRKAVCRLDAEEIALAKAAEMAGMVENPVLNLMARNAVQNLQNAIVNAFYNNASYSSKGIDIEFVTMQGKRKIISFHSNTQKIIAEKFIEVCSAVYNLQRMI